MQDKNALRIIDVNLNRVQEGLRVCEDVVRFILNDASSTRRLKTIRHTLQRTVAGSKINSLLLCEYRNVKKDVGRDFHWLEKKRDWQSIFFANMQRVKESLRVLEEFFRLLDTKAGKNFKDLRFKVYDAEKKIIAKSKTLSNRKHYPQPKTIIC